MSYYETIFVIIGIHCILALSVYLVFLTGQLSLGHGAFFGIGAYASAIFTMIYGVPFWLGLVIGGMISSVCGFILGIPVLRLKGLVLAIATLGFGQMINAIFLNFEYEVNVKGMLIGPKAGTGFRYIEPFATVGNVLFCLILCFIFVYLLERSRFGYAMLAIREEEEAARSIGIDVTKLKVISFTISAFIAGVAGGLHSHFMTFIHPLDFDYRLSIIALAYVAIGGVETLWGALFGTIFLIGFAESVRFVGEARLLVYGGLLVVVMIFRPRGLIDRQFLLAFSKKIFRQPKQTKG